MQIKNKIITREDVRRLNSEKNSTIILSNTMGQSADVIKELAPHVRIQIIGGYDGEKKQKYNTSRIQRRTYYSPSETSAIICKFEEYEQGINPSWSDLEKAVFMYKRLGETIKYEDADDVKRSNLNAILGKGICTGYASVFKEAMDRLGIECDMINEPARHTWNAIKINGKWYPIDLTWDASNIQTKGIDNLPWFGQNPAFNKYKNHDAKGEEVIPNNCFNPQDVSDALNKITSSNRYEPITQEENIELVFSRVLNDATNGSDYDKIYAGLSEVADFAFKIEPVYNRTAYTKDFDQKYGDLFQAITQNTNLSDEQKHNMLKGCDNIWKDVMGGIQYGDVHKHLQTKITYALQSMNIIAGNGDCSSLDRKLVKSQIEQIYDKCTSYGVVDMKKLQKASYIIDKKFEEMKMARENNQPVQSVESQLQISSSMEIVSCKPTSEEKIKSYIQSQIINYETFLNGLKESGENVQDSETQEIILACNKALECLYSNRRSCQKETIEQGA